ncbi:heat-inducible transcriptional repressor HrcA [Bacillus sp. FJAT-44742]|uniref:heat-inducible transcriptional repressor HrcA n=1 Tax=Bacillus sp. FJAT-44742 TaxID=2014005 RepID=UPI0012FEE603|nr:heat-inducible transcriptional repressor HrcA [Bacillus sp. FJAT-44742]
MLTKRQLFILQAIINDYIRSAEPVGSRSISKREDVGYSPATVRNEMADLEGLGFLEKPHSSSGRIPSHQGYRYYVDHLLMPHHLSTEELTDIKALFAEKIFETEHVIQQSAQILSELTSYISIVLGPEVFDTKLKHLQIIPLSDETAIAILVTDTGHVEKHSVTLPESLNNSDLEKVVNILNERLQGVPLFQMKQKLMHEVADVLKNNVDNYKSVLSFLEGSLQTGKPEKVFYGGKTNLLGQPEFKDVEKARLLLEFLEQDESVNRLLRASHNGITVKIGQENNIAAFEDCSIITATYSIGGKPVGTVGILGPTRMEYPRVIGLLDHLSRDLTKVLTDLYHKGP